MTHVIVVTPAGRRSYLDLLQHYIIKDTSILEWHLWDNCRDIEDRKYITELASRHDKIKVISIDNADGTNRSVNRFYRFCSDPGVFYIKMDDDIVYLPDKFGITMYNAAIIERGNYLWWSPIVINNAICSWLLKQVGILNVDAEITAQAGCIHGWKSPAFAEALHKEFQRLISSGAEIGIWNFTVSLSRFSINCIGFFGDDVISLGSEFCPPNVDDEEWLSAILPVKVGRPGRVIGNAAISHFSFSPQEAELVKTDILENYYSIAGVPMRFHAQSKSISFKRRIRMFLEDRLSYNGDASYNIRLDGVTGRREAETLRWGGHPPE